MRGGLAISGFGLVWFLLLGGFAFWLARIGRNENYVFNVALTATLPAAVLLVLGLARLIAGAIDWFQERWL